MPVRIERLELTPGAGFSIVGVPAIPAAGLIVGSGSGLDVWVHFAPDTAGIQQAALTAFVAHAGDKARSWTLVGEGIAAAAIVDEWIAEYPYFHDDALFVVDNGPGFERHLDSVRENLRAIATYYPHLSNRQWAVTTTGGTETSAPGELLADALGTRVLSSDAEDVETAFGQMIEAIEPSEDAIGLLEAGAAALEEAKSRDLFRPDVATTIVLISHRTESSRMSTYDFLAAVEAAAGEQRWTWLAIVAIAGFSGVCATDDGTLWTLGNWSGPLTDDICSLHWSKAIERVGWVSFGYFFARRLSAPANTPRAPIEVSFDGEPVPHLNGLGQPIWTYDGATQTITFKSMYSPDSGTLVRASYYGACAEPP